MAKLRLLPFDYTEQELNAGKGLTFHPLNGRLLEEMRLMTNGTWSYLLTIAWGDEKEYTAVAIGDGCDHKTGEPYLSHWRYDPFTGALLNPPKPSAVLTESAKPSAWGM